MKFKQILAIVMVCIFAFSGIGMAKAKSGGGFKAPATTTKSVAPAPKSNTDNASTAPKTEAPKNNATEAPKSNTATNNTTTNTANKTNATTNTTNNQQSGSRWGSALRNIGLFAGGMFLGSMLSNMFGLGGFMGDILGLIANVVLIGIVVMVIMAVYRKFFGKKNEGNVYASSHYAEDNFRCINCGWQAPDRNNPPKFCPECGTRLNGAQQNYQQYNQSYTQEQDAEFTQQSERKIVDITPPKDKDKF